MHVLVSIGQQEIVALVDTGSAVTVTSRSVCERILEQSKLSGPPIALTAFGRRVKWTLGSFEAELGICRSEFPCQVQVVKDE